MAAQAYCVGLFSLNEKFYSQKDHLLPPSLILNDSSTIRYSPGDFFISLLIFLKSPLNFDLLLFQSYLKFIMDLVALIQFFIEFFRCQLSGGCCFFMFHFYQATAYLKCFFLTVILILSEFNFLISFLITCHIPIFISSFQFSSHIAHLVHQRQGFVTTSVFHFVISQCFTSAFSRSSVRHLQCFQSKICQRSLLEFLDMPVDLQKGFIMRCTESFIVLIIPQYQVLPETLLLRTF